MHLTRASFSLVQAIHNTNNVSRLLLLTRPHLYSSARILSTKSKPASSFSYISTQNVATSCDKNAQVMLSTAYNLLGSMTSAKKVTGTKLPSNIVFRYCPTKLHDGSVCLTRPPSYDLASHSGADCVSPRPLLILFAWMQSIESHIEKYREFWFNRGFDVISIRTLPLHLLLPGIGGRRNGEILYSFLSEFTPRYDEIIFHAFSVGGYQLGEYQNILINECKNGNENAERQYSAIKGIVMDSCVYPEECPPGLSRAITTHPVLQPMLESSIRNFLKLTKPIVMDRYMIMHSLFRENPRCIPGLMLCSEADIVSSMKTNKEIYDRWAQKCSLSKFKCWKSSPHIMHYKHQPEDYAREVDAFLKQLNLKKARSLH